MQSSLILFKSRKLDEKSFFIDSDIRKSVFYYYIRKSVFQIMSKFKTCCDNQKITKLSIFYVLFQL